MQKVAIKKITFISIMSAISAILYIFIKFSLPIFPEFLQFNFSMLPILICTFALGPVEGLGVVLIRFIVKLIISSTRTAGVGEIADLILGSTVVLASGLFRTYSKGKKKDIYALIIGVITWVIVSIILNGVYCVPVYINLYFGGNKDSFIGLCSMIPGINEENYLTRYLLLAVAPFNFILSTVVIILTFIVHKRVKVLYESFNSDRRTRM